MFFLYIGINRLFAGGLMERAEELYLKIEEEYRSVCGGGTEAAPGGSGNNSLVAKYSQCYIIVQRKLKRMKEYLFELDSFKNISYSDYISNFQNKRTVERLIQLIVDAAVDINSRVLVDEGFPPPDDAFDSFIKTGGIGVYPAGFARAIAPSTGERNIIVHEYEAIDDGLVFDSINETLEMFREYVQYYIRYISGK